jgi:hypothetical protein
LPRAIAIAAELATLLCPAISRFLSRSAPLRVAPHRAPPSSFVLAEVSPLSRATFFLGDGHGTATMGTPPHCLAQPALARTALIVEP